MAKRQTAQAQPTLLLDEKPAAPKPEVAKPAKTKGAVVSIPHKNEPPKDILAVIANVAADPRVDASKMEKLLEVQERIMAENARMAFIRAFNALQNDLPTIRRDGKIVIQAKGSDGQRTGRVQQATPYATYKNIMIACKPLLRQHGFTFSSGIEPSPDGARIIVVSFLDHIDGHQRVSRFPLPAETSGSKNNIQGWGSSQSYGMRYNAIALLNIISEAREDEDIDGHQPAVSDRKKGAKTPGATVIENDEFDAGPETITDEQLNTLNAKMTACKVPLAAPLKTYKIEKLEDLLAADFDRAMAACDKYKAEVDARARG